ncbi:MAG: TonB-dependent receptor domain-containing protein [Rhodospirillaceae bacterium]
MLKSSHKPFSSKAAVIGRLLSMTAMCGSLALIGAYAAPAHAQAETQRFDLNIATGPLAEGLRRIQMQTGAKIAFSPQQMRDADSRGLVGSFTAEEAIQRLLEGTPFAMKSDDHSMFVISNTRSGAADTNPLFIRAAAVSTVEAPAQTAAVSATASAEIEEIVVTGTQILRDGYTSPTPLTVVGVQDIETAAPNNLSDYLGKMPALAGSSSPRSSGNSVSDGNGGVAALNLRFLGANRTLILLDGMRVGPSTENGASTAGEVDVNEFPDALVKRVDVVTGGASGAYGSDALAGVVNFVLDKEFVGVKGSIQGGITTYGDDEQYAATVTGGFGFAGGKGHFLVSMSQRFTAGVLHGSARNWVADNGWDIIQTPGYTTANGLPFYTVSRFVGSGLYAPGGLISPAGLTTAQAAVLVGTKFGPGGAPAKFQYGALNAGNANMIGGNWKETYPALTDTGEQYTTSLDDRLTRQNLFTRASYDLTDHVQVFGTFMYSQAKVLSYCCTSDNLITIKSGNPFIPAQVQAQMTALKVTQFQLGTLNLDIGAVGPANTRQKGFYALGASGDFDMAESNWKWNVFASRSLMRIHDKAINSPIKAVVDRSSDVVTDPGTGYPICRSTLTNPNDGCVPFNPMGVGVNSPATINAVLGGTSQMHTRILQDDFGGVLRAEPFSLWAGPVSVALGIEHRYTGSSGYAPPTDIASGFFLGNYHPTIGNLADTEGFIETVVPLAHETSWARELDFNGAIRETGYTLMGNVTTFKLGATWDGPDGALDGVRLRGTYSRDIRAPSLGDLFAGGRVGQGAQIDPFKGVSVPNVLSPTVGNPKLTPEIAHQTGLGAVYSPAWFPGFDVSFDAFFIDIKNVIASTSAQNVINACYAGNQAYCPFVIRDSAGALIQIISAPANTAFEKENGFDIEASYRKNLADFGASWSGNITLRVLATKIAKQDTVDALGNVSRAAGQNTGGIPTWTYNLSAGYDADIYAVTWTGRGIGSGKRNNNYTQCTSGCAVLTPPFYTVNDNYMPGAFYQDINLTYRLKDIGGGSAELFASVENFMDNNPDDFFVHNSNALYDRLGRIFRGGVRFKM